MNNSNEIQLIGIARNAEKYSKQGYLWMIIINDQFPEGLKVRGSINLTNPVVNGEKYKITGIMNSDFFTPIKVELIEKNKNKTDSIEQLLILEPFNLKQSTAKKIVKENPKNTLQKIFDKEINKEFFLELNYFYSLLFDEEVDKPDQQLIEQVNTRLYLLEIGIHPLTINSIIENDINIAQIKKDPFLLAYNVDGFTFSDGQKINNSLDINDNQKEINKYQAAIYYAIIENGSTYLNEEELIFKSSNIIKYSFQEALVYDALELGIKEKFFFKDQNKIFIKYLYDSEKFIEDKMMIINSAVDDLISKYEINNSFLDNFQNEALISVFENKITIVSGAPGTGKTTFLKVLLDNWKSNFGDLNHVHLMAPTGRAAVRMQESTGQKASTIHKFVASNLDIKNDENEENKNNLIIIDEMSMTDIVIFSELLKKIDISSKLLLIGDFNQLPSIRPGNLFQDIVNSYRFNWFELKNNHRQAEGSNIPTLFNEVLEGKINSFNFPDTKIIELNGGNYENIISEEVDVLRSQGVSTSKIQIITLLNKDVRNINNMLHPVFNESLTLAENRISVGDRVISNKNIDELGITNGDIGYVVDGAMNLKIRFSQNNEVVIKPENRKYISLAYAITVHKAQGGEFDNLIILLPYDVQTMNNKSLLYTAFSRAKENLILIGDIKNFAAGVKRTNEDRKTSLFK
jgi:exodeoxyribonuclease V alpha subunit